ncbi:MULTISPECIES: hypothetical protein [Serratia]|uniref:hypothetical protein n=1 Tax=Serratia TaxID=613 RepID=UPI001C42225C|nr:hypothetical protein [Serratia marcescens]EIM8486081.1 hypothetical protein [Serratia marcescens]EIU9511104.1 hypothetical protein [Serratia marcescens]ELE6466509.1 hypothetical protein [Serratia marcescens]HBH7050191.1 hypothetical protein [Serratia marcescens]
MSELTVLFLNCLFKVCDDGKFAESLITYQMLEHLKVTSIFDPKSALDIEPRKLDYKIGDKTTVSIYEMAYYMYGEKSFRQTTSQVKKPHMVLLGKIERIALTKYRKWYWSDLRTRSLFMGIGAENQIF